MIQSYTDYLKGTINFFRLYQGGRGGKTYKDGRGEDCCAMKSCLVDFVGEAATNSAHWASAISIEHVLPSSF